MVRLLGDLKASSMNADELQELMKAAFYSVTLDGGMSIRQAEVCDNYGTDNEGRQVTDADFAAIPRSEITDDWTSIPLAELERYPYLAYLDAKGFRYYIPAFLLSLFEDAQGTSMRVISTLPSVRPTRDLWLHHMQQYELLSEAQRSAIATLLFYLQDYPRLDTSDRHIVSAALQTYWSQYLPSKNEPNAA